VGRVLRNNVHGDLLSYLLGGCHPLRQHPALRPPGGPIAHPFKARGWNIPEALASFRRKDQHMLYKSLYSIKG